MKGLFIERMRKGATKLGLGSGKKISSRWRRSMGSLAAAEKTESESKSLYLCFSEKGRLSFDEPYTTQVIRRIKLNGDGKKEEKYLNGASYERFFKVSHTNPFALCCCIGSKIVLPFPAGLQATQTHFTLFDVSKSETELQKFSAPKIRPQAVVVDGKLYCVETASNLRRANNKYSFEVSDQIAGNENLPEWRLLDSPPFRDRKHNIFTLCFLEEKRILGWEDMKAGVYCFDTTKPENGWIETSFNLGNCIPFMYFGDDKPPIFIRHHHPVLGPFHIMFMYDPINSPLSVNFFFMLDDCDSFHIIKNASLHMPKSYKKYTRDPDPDYYDYDDYQPVVSTDFEFVPLGGEKVCLVLNKFFPNSHRRKKLRNTGTLLLVTFEYKIITTTTDGSPIEIEARLLKTRRFQYHSRGLGGPGPTWTDEVHMDGVFLL